MERVERPWGWYESLCDDDGYKVKRLYVSPNQKISLQYHEFRSEHWVVVSGSGTIELSNSTKDVKVGNYIFVPTNTKHRITGGECGIMIIEVQQGSLCVEEDIIRLVDEYGRI